FSYSINWGDGQPAQNFTGLANTTANHTFGKPGTYTITITATDQDDHTSAATTLQQTIVGTELQNGTLAVGVSSGGYSYSFSPGAAAGSVVVSGSGTGAPTLDPATFTPSSGQVVIYGQAGSDAVTINGSANADTFNIGSNSIGVGGITYSGTSIDNYKLNGLNG